MSLAFSYIHKCKLAAIDRSVLFVFPSKNGSDSLNSEAAVFCVTNGVRVHHRGLFQYLLSLDSRAVSGTRGPSRMPDPERVRV